MVKSGERQVMLKHLKELIADASTYGWEPVRAYNGVWLQQLENGRAEWHDTKLKLEFTAMFEFKVHDWASLAIPQVSLKKKTCPNVPGYD